MSTGGAAQGSGQLTERLLAESRELLRDLSERLRGEDGAIGNSDSSDGNGA